MQDNSLPEFPLAVIVIPTFNGGKTIEETIRSVLIQSYENFKLYVIDNCSTDDTLDIINDINDDRINVIKNDTNIGFEGNWNKALSLSSGKYFKVLPDDDVLEVDNLSKAISIMEKIEDVVLVGCKRKIINENNKVIMSRGK